MIRKKKNKKIPLGKKPFLVLSRRAIAGWAAVLFFVCAWMFVIGVLVGRGTAPLKFDTASLQKKLQSARADAAKPAPNRNSRGSTRVKDKTRLDFYEALKENREDAKIEKIAPARIISKKIVPASEKPPVRRKKPVVSPSGKTPKTAVKKQAPPPKTAKESPKPQPVPTTRSEPAGSGYTIQVAAVKAAADADRLVARLKKKGFAAYRAIGKIPGKGIWYRIRVGHFSSRAAARPTVERLKKIGKKPIVVKK